LAGPPGTKNPCGPDLRIHGKTSGEKDPGDAVDAKAVRTDAAAVNGCRDPLAISEEIDAVRSRNNRNWMDLVRLAYRHAPDEATTNVHRVYCENAKVSEPVRKLLDRP
jgi:hypothetical protein